MYRIIGGRGCGKTKALMLAAKENNAIIICKNPSSMEQKAKAYGIIGVNFASYDEYIDYLAGYGNSQLKSSNSIFIDELDMFTKYFNIDFNGYTLTNED